MPECPQADCREDLICRVNKRILRSTAMWAIGIIITIIGISGGLVYRGYSGGQETQNKAIEENRQKSQECKESQAELKTSMKYIEQKVQKLEDQSEKILDKLDDIQKEIRNNE